MPRPARALEEGRIYHVYNRVGGDAKPFTDEELASRFVQLLRKAEKEGRLDGYPCQLCGSRYNSHEDAEGCCRTVIS